MTYSELKNFTWGDLSNFTWGDLKLDKYELMAKAENGSIALPPDVKERFQTLCTELPEQYMKEIPKVNVKTVSDFLAVALQILNIAKIANDLGLGLALKNLLDAVFSNPQ